MAESLVSLRGIGLRRQGSELLNNIDLELAPGEIVSLIGPNGAGKTTLVKVLLGLEHASEGTIARAPKLRIGYMPQKLVLNTNLPLSVGRFLKLSVCEHSHMDWALARAGAEHLQCRSMHKLSGGETQRVLLARALLAKPQLLVLDEPAQGVDIAGQQALYQRISQLREELDCAVLVVSHDLHWVMAQTDRVVCLNQHICCHGHPDNISNDPAYLTLFGERLPPALAPYHHEHDHAHDMHGNVVEEGTEESAHRGPGMST